MPYNTINISTRWFCKKILQTIHTCFWPYIVIIISWHPATSLLAPAKNLHVSVRPWWSEINSSCHNIYMLCTLCKCVLEIGLLITLLKMWISWQGLTLNCQSCSQRDALILLNLLEVIHQIILFHVTRIVCHGSYLWTNNLQIQSDYQSSLCVIWSDVYNRHGNIHS